MLKKATHSYVASLSCGCGVGICIDEVDRQEWTAETVRDYINAGYQVQRYEHQAAVDAFTLRCEKYPHEPWQHRNEAAALKHRSKLPLTVGAVDPVDGVVAPGLRAMRKAFEVD